MSEHEFILPCYMWVGVKKPRKISLTLNWYRNAFAHTNNAIKQAYAPVKGSAGFKASRVRIHYHLFLASGARTDVMNWISVADKFFSDWLVGQGVVKDDGFRYMGSGGWDCSIDRSAPENYIKATVVAMEDVA